MRSHCAHHAADDETADSHSVGTYRRPARHEWINHEGWGGCEQHVESKDNKRRVKKLLWLSKQDPAHVLHVLAAQGRSHNPSQNLPARLRALDRKTLARLSPTAPLPQAAGARTPFSSDAAAADYHPAPFTPGKVQFQKFTYCHDNPKPLITENPAYNKEFILNL